MKFHTMPAGYITVIRTISDKFEIEKIDLIDKKIQELKKMKDFKNVDLPTLNYALYK